MIFQKFKLKICLNTLNKKLVILLTMSGLMISNLIVGGLMVLIYNKVKEAEELKLLFLQFLPTTLNI